VFDYFRPKTFDDAVAILRDGPCQIVAGCTDYYASLPRPMSSDRVLDLTALTTARGITESGEGVRIGALTTWTDIADATLPPAFDALQYAARQIGGVQIQNAGTLGGNVCNASPAADGVPPLLVLDAFVELLGQRGARRLPVSEFLVGSRHTKIENDEILTAIHVPKRRGIEVSTFEKLGARAYQVISISIVAGVLTIDAATRRISRAAFAVGACSATAQRLPELEAALVGGSIGDSQLRAFQAEAYLSPLNPISDIRGTAEYRLDATATLIRRALTRLQEALA
jgi:CO/xanthine dehydrogenase FAD-binding subunit